MFNKSDTKLNYQCVLFINYYYLTYKNRKIILT